MGLPRIIMIIPTFSLSSLVTPQVIVMTASCVHSDTKFRIMTSLFFNNFKGLPCCPHRYLAQQKEELRIMSITHILNAAQGTGTLQVDTTAETYAHMNIQFYGVKAMDKDDCDLSQYFRPAAEFIHKAVDHENGNFVLPSFSANLSLFTPPPPPPPPPSLYLTLVVLKWEHDIAVTP